jgi:hypothetical protein
MMAKKTSKTKTPKKRYTPRQTRKFQLRLDHPIDVHVSEILDYSRSKRREVTVIRDGVRLLWALENNDLSILFELFPHLKDQFLPGGVNLIDQIRSMLQESSLPAEMSVQPSGPKLMNAPTFALPIFEDNEDDLPTIITHKDTHNNAAHNFLKGIMGLQ